MSDSNDSNPTSGQMELNILHLQMKIAADKKQTAKELAFKAIEDAKWDRIKKERARKKRMRETKGKG